MDNYFGVIGQIVRDLRCNVIFDPFDNSLDVIGQEFSEMIMSVAITWINNPIDLPYFMEFHQAEGERLLAIVKTEHSRYKGIPLDTERLRFINHVCTLLMDALTEFLDRLALMLTTDPQVLKTSRWDVN